MSLIYISVILGMVQIAEYSAEDAKLRKVISYCKIAAIFLAIGIVLGRAVS